MLYNDASDVYSLRTHYFWRMGFSRHTVKRRRRLKFKPRFYVIMAALVLAITAVLVLVIPGRAWGITAVRSCVQSFEYTTAIIRNETSVEIEKFDKLVYLAAEGEYVDVGAPVATVLKWGYSDDMMQSLLLIESDIYSAQLSDMEGIGDADLASIDLEISAVCSEIRSTVSDKTDGDLETLERRLDALLDRRSEYLRQKVYATEKLSALYRDADARRAQLSEWSSTIVAPSQGIVSFYFDGFEQALNANKLDMITSNLVSSAIKGTAASYTQQESSTRIFRLVDGSEWYCAFLTKTSDPLRVARGVEYDIVFDGYGEKVYRGIALEPVISGKNVVNILKINDDLGSFLCIRKIKASISTSVTGIEVNSDAVFINDEGIPYIQLADGSNKATEVDVLAIDDGFAIVRCRIPGETISAGQNYSKPKVSNFEKLMDKIREIF